MLFCMRTTINLDDALLRAAKGHAAATGRTLTAVISDALRRELSPRPNGLPERPAVPVSGLQGSGPQPGVDLDDNAALLDLMEGR
jgi:hypothetical protein